LTQPADLLMRRLLMSKWLLATRFVQQRIHQIEFIGVLALVRLGPAEKLSGRPVVLDAFDAAPLHRARVSQRRED
jgi:hypothetical protein